MAKLSVGLEQSDLPSNIIQLPVGSGMPPTPPTMQKANTPITQEALTALDFGKIHMNAAWSGGWFRYYKAIPDLHRGEITVTFGDHYCLEYDRDSLVWLSCDHTDMLLSHVTTMEQLAQLWKLVTGKELIDG